MLILGNIFSLIASIFLVMSTFPKTKKNLIKFQIGDCTSNIVANLLLGGVSGAIVSVFGLVRNLLVYSKKGTKVIYSIVVSSMFITGVFYNNRGWVGYLPIMASVVYSLTMCNESSSSTSIKKALVLNVSAWLIYNITILAVPSVITNSVVLSSTIYNLIKTPNMNNLAHNGLTQEQRGVIREEIKNCN